MPVSRALLRERRQLEKQERYLHLREMTVFVDRHEAVIGPRKIRFSKTEFELLVYLILNKNIVLSRSRILEEVWGYGFAGDTNTSTSISVIFAANSVPTTATISVRFGESAMWQKINRWLIRQVLIAPLPIFAKMVLLYSAIVFFILLTVSVATLTSIHYIMNNALRDQLMDNAEAAVQYLDTYGKVDTTIFVQANIPPQMNLQIYDGAGHLIIDNGPTHAVRKLSDRYIDDAISTPDENPLPTKVQGNEASEFSYYRLWTNKQGMNYYLRFSQRPDKETNFISLLSKQLLASILISLILTIVTGMYFMKKSLAPLKVINDTVKTIEVNRLDNRIALSDNKNELHDLAVTINQALDRIEYGYKKQQQFISDASHELRTPITVIAGYTDLLDRWGKEDPAVLNEGLTAIKSETDYMKQLTERLLFFARSNNGTLIKHFTEIDTAQLLQEVYSEITLIDKEHDIRLTDNDKAVITPNREASNRCFVFLSTMP